MEKIQLIRKMCNENPDNAELLYLLAIEYKDAGMFKEAITTLSDALKNADGELFDKIMKELVEVKAKKPVEQAIKSDEIDSNINDTSNNRNINVVSINTKIESNIIDETTDDTEVLHTDINTNDANEDIYDGAAETDNIESPTDNLIDLRLIKGGNATNNVASKSNGLAATTFDDVGGLEDLKKSIRMKIIKPFLTPGLFEKFKKKSGGGLLLFGPPGCGKTFIARATAGECHANFKPVYITDVLDPYFGQSAQNIKDIFTVARAHKPCILFFDELDTIGFNRSKSSTDMLRSIVDQLLSEIEGIDSNTEKILIIGATNMPWDIDPALRRPGRFDKTIFVAPPDIVARETIFKLKMAGKPCDEINFKLLAKESELFSGADIENVIELATENVLEEILSTGYERNLTQQDLLNALKSVKPSTLEWLRTISNYVKYSNQTGAYDDVEAFLNKNKKLL